MIAYINIEELSGLRELNDVPYQVLEECSSFDLTVLENTEYYFVLKLLYDEDEEVSELVSAISFILCSLDTNRFKVTIHHE